MLPGNPIHQSRPKWLNTSTVLAVVTLLTVVLVALLVYIGTYNHPSPLDDFEDATWTNYLQAQVHLYKGWSGRYFTNLVLTLNPIHWNAFGVYRAVGILLVLGLSTGIFALVRKALSSYLTIPGRLSTLIAMATVLLVLNNLGSLVEAFYWYSSSMTYTLSILLVLLWLAVLIWVDRSTAGKPTPLQYAISILLVLAIAGCNETAMMFTAAVGGGLLAWYSMNGATHRRRFCTVIFIFSLIGIAAVALAPGTINRHVMTTRNMWMAFPTWIYHTQRQAIMWVSDPLLLLYSGLLLLIFNRHGLKKPVVHIAIAFLIPFALLFLLCFPAHFGLGTQPPPRVYNFIYVFFVLAWMFFLLHLALHIRKAGICIVDAFGRPKPLVIIAGILITLLSLNTHHLKDTSFYRVAKTLVKHIPQTYNAEMTYRYEVLRTTLKDTVVVPPLRATQDNVLFFHDIASHPNTMTNKFYAEHWNKVAIYTDSNLVSR